MNQIISEQKEEIKVRKEVKEEPPKNKKTKKKKKNNIAKKIFIWYNFNTIN